MSRFDDKLDRRGTGCMKWDAVDKGFESEGMLPMWVADMDFETPPAVTEAIIKRATHGAFGYPIVPKEYYESLINWEKRRHNWEIQREWIAYTPGVIPALYWSIGAFTRPGEKVLVQSPVYYVFYGAIKARKREAVVNQLVETPDGYRIDFEDLEKKLSDPLVKLMIMCSPHNPVGRVWTKEELEKVSALCVKYGVLLVADEIHNDLIWKGHTHYPAASINEEAANNTIVCVSTSKTFNLAGLGTANVIIPNKEIRERFIEERRTSSIHDPEIFGIVSQIAAYDHGDAWLDDLMEYLEGNFDFVQDWLSRNLPQVKVRKPEGTYMIWLDFRYLGMNKDELKAFFAQKAKVAMDQGAWFGAGGEGFARMNIACHRSTVQEGLERIKAAIDKL